MKKKRSALSTAGTGIFTILGIVYILPILIVLMNSFKKKVYINKQPFQLPDGKTMAGLENYMTAIDKYNLLSAVGWTVFITVGSVLVILVCTSMCAWYITRVKSKFTKLLYLLCVFSMVVPFQMVMFTLSLVADRTGLRTPWGIIIIYLGFGAGLAVFMFCGFVKSNRDRGSSNDRRLHTDPYIFQCSTSDHEADLHLCWYSRDNVDLE